MHLKIIYRFSYIYVVVSLIIYFDLVAAGEHDITHGFTILTVKENIVISHLPMIDGRIQLLEYNTLKSHVLYSSFFKLCRYFTALGIKEHSLPRRKHLHL